jgi:hypothetical protein
MDMEQHWKVVSPPAKGPPPQPNLSTPWQICGKSMAFASFAEPRAATPPSPLCRNENSHNALCLKSAA